MKEIYIKTNLSEELANDFKLMLQYLKDSKVICDYQADIWNCEGDIANYTIWYCDCELYKIFSYGKLLDSTNG